MISDIIDSGYVGHQSSGKFAASGINGCWREKYFSLWKKYKKEWTKAQLRTFAIGDFVHRMCVKELMTNAGSHGFELVATEVDIPTQEYLSGRIDCVISRMKDGVRMIVDFKSASDWAIKAAKNGNVSATYIDQINTYMYLTNIHIGYIVYVSKGNGQIYEHEVEYDEERAKLKLKEIEDFFIKNVFTGTLPAKCSGGEWGCGICKVKGSKKDSYDEIDFDIMEAQDEIQQYLLKGGTYKELYNG